VLSCDSWWWLRQRYYNRSNAMTIKDIIVSVTDQLAYSQGSKITTTEFSFALCTRITSKILLIFSFIITIRQLFGWLIWCHAYLFLVSNSQNFILLKQKTYRMSAWYFVWKVYFENRDQMLDRRKLHNSATLNWNDRKEYCQLWDRKQNKLWRKNLSNVLPVGNTNSINHECNLLLAALPMA
jgi:hypothetical protein